ncbi:MAG TPA: hypothetical protein VFY42_02925 [Gemmatimonadales bacterium]|nr:hypothetical protein [Gemmatimonadales bacterium]
MIRIWSAALGLMLLAGRAEAQGLSPLVKYGKWVLVAGAAGMNYLGIRAHNRAEDAFDALESSCGTTRTRCNLGSDGRYVDPQIEAFYQRSLRYDRIARGWLIGGETALAGAAVLFVWELTRPKGRPDNIPFEPEVRSLRGGTGLGFRVRF